MSQPILEIKGIAKRFGFFGSAPARGFARGFVEAPMRFNAARTSEAPPELPALFAGIDTARSKKYRRTSRVLAQ